MSKTSFSGLQVLAYAQQSRECSNYEQASLSERMQEHIRQIDRGSKLSLTSYFGPSSGDAMQPFASGSQKVIEVVMQSAAKGKVISDLLLNFCVLFLENLTLC